MNNQEQGKKKNGCIAYLTSGGLVGLLGVIAAYLGLFMGNSSGGGNTPVAPPDRPNTSPTSTTVIQGPAYQEVTGVWKTEPDYGYSYRFTQSGAYVIVEEVAPNGVITGYGEGVISGTNIGIDYISADGSLGTAQFTVSSSGNQMTGTFTNWAFGSQASALLTRH